MKSLQTKIFLLFVVLLLSVQAIGLWMIFEGNRTRVTQEIDNRLQTAQTIFTEQFYSRREYLNAFAETAARDYGIKEVFNDDTRSLLVALNNHRKRIDADLAMTISENAVITGQLQVNHQADGTAKVVAGSERNQAFRFPTWLESEQEGYLYMLDDKLYQLSLSPLRVGSRTIGWVGFGFQLDNRLAQHFEGITRLEIDFLVCKVAINSGSTAVTALSATSNPANGKTPDWHMIASSNAGSDLSFARSILDGKTPDQYIATSYVVTTENQQKFGVAMYGLRSDIVEVLRGQWLEFVILAVATLLLSLFSAYWIAASITKPIKRLVKQAKTVAKGHYDQRVAIEDQSELGQLATEFNAMQKAVLTREQAIKHSANHDALTDLPNRNLLKSTLTDLIDGEISCAVLHLNLSRLKDVNETLGHEVGDWLIVEAAKRLGKVKGVELLSHLGGDEFVILIRVGDQQDHATLVNRIYAVLEASCEFKGISLQLQTRIGVSYFPEHSQDPKTLLQMADMALHFTAKNRQEVQVYEPSLNVNSVERLSLINDLKAAIAQEQLELHYQPKVDLSTGTVTHVEALVRWQHPQLGMVAPDEFIHIAEQTGQINALTQAVFVMALNQQKLWQKDGIELNVAVNISAKNLSDRDFFGFVCQAISERDISANQVTLEVTESVVVDEPEAAIVLLQQFKAEGFKLSIDDYGTGYSSLAQLKHLPVHELKIDKSFVQKLKDDEDDQSIVRSTIELAHSMGLSVVAEGVEDEYAIKWLAAYGCELAQGYFISRPLPADKLTPWLLQSPTFGTDKSSAVTELTP